MRETATEGDSKSSVVVPIDVAYIIEFFDFLLALNSNSTSRFNRS